MSLVERLAARSRRWVASVIGAVDGLARLAQERTDLLTDRLAHTCDELGSAVDFRFGQRNMRAVETLHLSRPMQYVTKAKKEHPAHRGAE